MAYEQKEEATEKSEDEKILIDSRRELRECIDDESSDRAKMMDDIKFLALDQWPQEIRNEREGDVENGARPCLTVDQINQYRNQVVNDIRQGKPGINVRPQDDVADIKTAKILKGLVRNIEDQSNSDIAYITAVGSAVDIGVGYFRVVTEYTSDDSFDQEIFIRPIANTFSVRLGRHTQPDGSDAEIGFIAESMSIEKFKEMFPGKKHAQGDFDGIGSEMVGDWITDETITVVEKYCFKRERDELYFLADGSTMPKAMYEKWPAEAGPRPEIKGSRQTFRKQLKWYKMTGVEVLEKRDLPGKWIPIVEVVGREAWVDGKRHLWGIVRPAKDSLRMYNYWASTITERMALAPKQPYVGAKGQFEGLEDRWRKANRASQAYLEYNPIDVNGNALPAPKREGPVQIEAALLQQMDVIRQDVRSSLGIFKAGVGESESQQSGRAILALQRESDTGTFHYGGNLGLSIRHAGRIVVDMIPHYYDTKRVVRVLGEDGEIQTATLDPDLESSYAETSNGVLFNPGMGKYDVSITTGPSYNTKRMEAQATFVELAKGAADPISSMLLRYLTVKNSDFDGAQEASKALRALLPPPVQEALSGKLPPEVQAVVAQAKMQIEALQKELQEEQAGTKVAALKVQGDHQAKLVQAQADHDAKMKALALEREVAAEQARLDREKAQAEFELKKWQAEKDAELNLAACTDKQNLAEREAQFEAQQTDKKFKAEQEQRAFDNDMKVRQENEKEGAKVMPAIEKLMKELVELQKQTLEEMKKPKKVTLGDVQVGADGKVKGATVAARTLQ